MVHDLGLAVIAGIIGTIVMTSLMLIAKRMNLPAVDAHGILGYMQHADRASVLGYLMHGFLGAIFGIGYVLVFLYVPSNLMLMSILLGIVHWLIVGWMFALAPLAHAGMKAGTIEPTGAYMLKSLGFVGFIAGTIGHIVFGITVAVVYITLGGTVAVV